VGTMFSFEFISNWATSLQHIMDSKVTANSRMSNHPDFDKPTPQSIAKYVKRNAKRVKSCNKMKMGRGGTETLREADYKGHHIIVRTTYRVTIDSTPVTGVLSVSNDGQVHYHAVPNLSFDSAVDLVKKLIDVFPDDFKKERSKGKRGVPRTDMPGMVMGGKRNKK
jgi:hypothetical protein